MPSLKLINLPNESCFLFASVVDGPSQVADVHEQSFAEVFHAEKRRWPPSIVDTSNPSSSDDLTSSVIFFSSAPESIRDSDTPLAGTEG